MNRLLTIWATACSRIARRWRVGSTGPQPAVRPRQPEGGEFQRRGDPVVSVDKKIRWATSATAVGKWRPKGEPEEVRMHDFKVGELGKAIPYGVYDLAANNGCVTVGVD